MEFSKIAPLLSILLAEVWGECLFPEFLWLTNTEDNYRIWFTETRYPDSSHNWNSRQVIEVTKAEMTSRMKRPVECPDYEGAGGTPCFSENFLYRRYCLHDLDGEKYKVRQGDSGHERYTCMKFVQRGENVVQVWMSRLRPVMTDDICDNDQLVRVEWPWTGDTKFTWTPCPIIGGFNFNAYLNERKRRLCHREWRPSRMESECVIGDGMTFLFPDKACSPFEIREYETQLQCWTNWTEAAYSFIMLAKGTSAPQYVLRLPLGHGNLDSFDGKMYFSPVTPLEERGIPPGNAMHIHMEFTRSESGVCFDETREVCQEYAADGQCTSGMHQIGNYCKRSCGLCKLSPSPTAECHFPLPFQGRWLLFERDRREEVGVHSGQIDFSQSGSYVCKSKHWEEDQYKMLAVFENGCRPRFACIHFKYQENGNIMQFRISSSERTDKSFDMCHFMDDPPPLGNRFRSEDFKVLLPLSRTVVNSCGLGGLVYVDAMFADDGVSCHATLSDWNPFHCQESNTMVLSFRSCTRDETVEHQEFSCEAYVNMQDDFRLLITRQAGEEDRYSCWIIRTNSRTENQPWNQAYILRRAQCGAPEDLDPVIYKPAEIAFQIYRIGPVPKDDAQSTATVSTKMSIDEDIEKDCIVINKGSTVYASTIQYTVRKGATQGKIQRDKDTRQHTATARSSAPSSSSAVRETPVDFFYTCLVHILSLFTFWHT